MEITMTPTNMIITNEAMPDFPWRVWEGVTEKGTACKILVAGVLVEDTKTQKEFQGLMHNTEISIPSHYLLDPETN